MPKYRYIGLRIIIFFVLGAIIIGSLEKILSLKFVQNVKVLIRINKNSPSNIGAFALNEFARRHYFMDGNKKTAYAIAKTLMLVNKCHLKIKYKEATNFIIKIAEYNSKVTFDEIKVWIQENCIPVSEKILENYLSRTFVNIMLGDEENG